jgi:oxygen-independent coproporphyrinogen-3 oxidase
MGRAIYIHIPFCASKCFYCDFTSFAGLEALWPDYVEALISEISRARPRGPVETIYFGGGTPSILPAYQLLAVLSAITERFEVEPDAEITLEANPGTADLPKLRSLRNAGAPAEVRPSSENGDPALSSPLCGGGDKPGIKSTLKAPGSLGNEKQGFNRLSLGVQSFDDEMLKRIGRIHSAEEALAAYRMAREAGFDNISIDLIYGLPNQTLKDWQRELEHLLELRPEHVSIYELSIEEGTPFARKQEAGELELPDEETRLEMYEAAIGSLALAGYEHYEISNFARPGFRSRHNQVYWRNESYHGFGAGAARYLDGVRCSLTKSIQHYISCARLKIDPIESCERLTGRGLMGETIMLGLRSSDGIDLGEFRERFGVSLMEAYGDAIERLQGDGLVELNEERLRLTHKGLLVANRVVVEFVEEQDSD